MAARGYANRSEAIRDLARSGLQQHAMQAAGRQQCLAALIYVYDHHQRELPKRLTSDFHDHHDLARATLHVHLDHESCMEVTVLKDPAKTCRSSPTTSSPNEGCDTVRSYICQRCLIPTDRDTATATSTGIARRPESKIPLALSVATRRWI